MSRYNELTVDKLIVSNDIVTGSTPSPVMFTAAKEAITAAGAVNVTSYLTTVAAGGAIAITLADGTVKGQMKKIVCILATGNATLTPANFGNGATVTFSVVGDTVELIWDGTNWQAISIYNQATGSGATPVIA